MKKFIRVLFQDSTQNYNTSINAPALEHVDYFVGQNLNVGSGPEDNLHKCIGVAQVVSSNDLNAEDLTYVGIYNPHSNRNLPAIYSKVHGGIVGFIEENKPYYNDAVLGQVGNVFVDDVQLLIFPTWKCHDTTHRLVVETTIEADKGIRLYRSDK
jgi:hypothetical protein